MKYDIKDRHKTNPKLYLAGYGEGIGFVPFFVMTGI